MVAGAAGGGGVQAARTRLAINTSVIQAAKALIKNGEVSPGLLNKVEMAFRCYDPCNSCGTHALNGGPAIEVTVKRRDGSVLTQQRNF